MYFIAITYYYYTFKFEWLRYWRNSGHIFGDAIFISNGIIIIGTNKNLISDDAIKNLRLLISNLEVLIYPSST